MNEDKAKLFETQLGQGATIQRETYGGELVSKCNHELRVMGAKLNPVEGESLEYLGSAAVHVYKSPLLDQMFFLSQVSTLHDTPEVLAAKAITDLKNEAMKFYGRKPQRKRSGF